MHTPPKLSTREIQESDINSIAEYWLGATPEYLRGMGADPDKMPAREQWQQMLTLQLQQSYPEKQAYATIWEVNGEAIGHCNVNKIKFGDEAFMHLHIWKPVARKAGFGAELVKKSLPFFFHNLQLKTLYCEPYALNPAPNSTLKKVGFDFVQEYTTIPGAINFEQPVKLWKLTREKFQTL